MTLTRAERAALPDEAFAVPAKRLLPITDQKHVAMARNQVSAVKGVNDDERAEARLRIRAQAERLGMDTSTWDSIRSMRLEAMAIEMPDGSDHPNRMPFSGVLVRLDEISCSAPHGSKGKKIVMSASAAEAALGSLLGMAVDFTPDFDGHDAQRKFGVITAANIEGSDLRVEGFIYAADFPTEAATVRSKKDTMGFSFEAQRILVEDFDADPLVITDCVFTGAAILLKDKAAFTTTSLAASAAGDIEMTKEELEAILAAATKPLMDKINQLEAGQTELGTKIEAGKELHAKVAPHAEKLRQAAVAMEAAGIGTHAENGQAALLKRMADNMEAEAMGGNMPHIFRAYDGPRYYASAEGKGDEAATIAAAVEAATKPLLEKVSTLETKLADGISAARDTAKEPERKTLSPQITAIMAKAGIEAPGEGKKLSSADLDKVLAGSSVSERFRLKAAFGQAGLID